MAGPVDGGAATPDVRLPLMRQNITPGLDGAVKLHPADSNRTLDVTVSLGLRNQPALAAFIRQVSDPRSPRYGRYLSAAQFAAAYGPTRNQVQQVTSHLRGQGLAVTSVSSNRALVRATGPLHAVEAAFGVTISDWHDQRLNSDFFGNDTQPSLPASIAPLVVGVFGLENHFRFQHHAIRSSLLAPRVGGGPAGGYTPTELKTAYDVNPLAAQGINGSGQSLGLFELDGFKQANLTTYDTHYSIATSPPTRIVVGAGPNPALGLGEIEVELDIEVMQAFAPGASITVWEGQNSAQGAVDTYNAMVTSNSTASNSTSWGACEPDTPISLMDTLDQSFQQAAAQGQSFFAASGDFGAYDCRQFTPGSTQVVVDNPASDPFITGVGATTLLLNANSTYKSESAWSNSAAAPPRGSGGGLSTHFAQPAWQTGPGVSNGSSNGMRQVPDVALDGDPQTGYSIYSTNNATSPPTTGWFEIGGTSAGAPSWAAFTALYNQFAKSFSRGNLGFASPSLYAAGTSAQPTPPYHDITTGDNLVYLANPGWDYPTGWGTPNVTSLVAEILAARSPFRPWLDHAVAGGSAPLTPWYRPHAVPAAAITPNVVPPPSPLLHQPLAPWFMAQVVARLTTFLR